MGGDPLPAPKRPSWATEATMEREEAIVRRETALRLVPLDQLARFIARRHPDPITAELVAQEADVTPAVAHRALVDLDRVHRAHIARAMSAEG